MGQSKLLIKLTKKRNFEQKVCTQESVQYKTYILCYILYVFKYVDDSPESTILYVSCHPWAALLLCVARGPVVVSYLAGNRISSDPHSLLTSSDIHRRPVLSLCESWPPSGRCPAGSAEETDQTDCCSGTPSSHYQKRSRAGRAIIEIQHGDFAKIKNIQQNITQDNKKVCSLDLKT